MDRPSSYSVAPGDASRSRILSWGALAGMVALAVGGLVLVFPKSDLMTLLRSNLDAKGRDRGNRDLSIAYLRNIIRTEPDDMGLRLLLAEKLLAGGDLLVKAAMAVLLLAPYRALLPHLQTWVPAR